VLVEPLAAAIRTFELAPVSQDDVVVVLGCGRLGRLVALVAHKAGARVIAVGRSRKHLELVSSYCWKGFTTEMDAAGGHVEWVQDQTQLREAVLNLTEGLGADVVVEATGANANILLAQQLTRPLGVVSLKSTSGVKVNSFDSTKAIVDELRFQCSRCGPFDKAIQFMMEHGVPNQSWITAYYPLSGVAEAIEAAAHEPKVVIRCDTL
jgi:threonine dehydrogenase-like Zn-dependent dehydrogenase